MKQTKEVLLQKLSEMEFTKNYPDVIAEAKRLLSERTNPEHNWEHTLKIVENTLELLIEYNHYQSWFWNVCLTSAYWHDVGYGSEAPDRASVNMLEEFLKTSNKWSKDRITLCVDAVRNQHRAVTTYNSTDFILNDAIKLEYRGTSLTNEF